MKTEIKSIKLLMNARQLLSGRVDFSTFEEVSKVLALAVWARILFRVNGPLTHSLIHYEPPLGNGKLRRLI